MVGNSKSSLFHLIFRTRRRSISGEKRVVWIPIVGFEGGLFFNKIDEFLLAEKLFALTWKSALIVTSVVRGITLSVNVSRGHDSRYKSYRTLIQSRIIRRLKKQSCLAIFSPFFVLIQYLAVKFR